MSLSDLIFIFQWWMVFFGVGLVFLPLTINIFPNFFDRGYIFAKILGIIIVSYAVFFLGIVKVLPFTIPTILLVTAFFAAINILILKKYWKSKIEQWNNKTIAIFLFEELLFLGALLLWSFIRAHQPDINGLEKFMDFGFINSILRSEYFPPKDMWLTPYPINYYYFGHLVTAVLTKLSGIPSLITYNLMLSTIFAFTFTGAFSIGANLYALMTNKAGDASRGAPRGDPRLVRRVGNAWGWRAAGPAIAGFLTASLVSLSGNLHAIYAFFKPYVNENPVPFWQLVASIQTFPNAYWYPNATRFIHNTIHEFPLYSFVVSDLHGHVLDIPVVLLTIAVLLSLIFNFQFSIFNQIKNYKNKNSFQISNLKFQILLITFLLAIMYMTNVWDGIIYLILTIIVIYCIRLKSRSILFLVIGFIVFSLPFSINFKPFASGIGILCAPNLLTDIGKIGPFLFEPDHCQKSPLWQLLILYGFFYFWVVAFIIFIFGRVNSKHEYRNSKQYQMTKIQNSKHFEHSDFKNLNLFRISDFGFRIFISDIFVFLLIVFSTLLIIIPEFIYVKDIYPAHYRANTMFKFVYQAFIMLSIASGYIIIRIITNFKFQISNFKFSYCKLVVLVFIGSIGLFLVMVYPYFAINSYYGDLKTYYGLDGTRYLNKLYPSDYQAIAWINKNIKAQPVVLEAQGDSYTDYGRVSSNTGLPTVLGWTVHEWLWRGTYDIPAPRISEVQNLYETKNIELTKKLIKKYEIKLIFIGDLERQKYPKLYEKKFMQLGKIIFEKNQTRIYQLN